MSKSRGFSLVDVLVGLAIGVFGVLAVTKVLVGFTQERNTISQTIDTQSNGTMALYLIERDMGQAGYGMMSFQNCAQINWYWNDPACDASCGTQTALPSLPVGIQDGGAASDIIRIQYGVTNSGAPATSLTLSQAAWADSYNVASSVGFTNNDFIVADVGGSCTLSQVTDVEKGGLPRTVWHDSVGSYFNPSSSNTPPPGAPPGWELAQAQNALVNLGAFVSRVYRVSNTGVLTVASFPNFQNSGLVEGIVLMKAQYGMDNDNDGIVDAWQGADTAVVSNMRQVLAVRIGIVARSPLYEKAGIDAPTNLTVLPAGVGPAVNYTVPDLDSDGKSHYRYKVYSTVIPLRNVIWGR